MLPTKLERLPVSGMRGDYPTTCKEGELDRGIGSVVNIFRAAGIETIESCQGKKGIDSGHAYEYPCIRFLGGPGEGYRALAIANEHQMPVKEIRRVWPIILGAIEEGPTWWIDFQYSY